MDSASEKKSRVKPMIGALAADEQALLLAAQGLLNCETIASRKLRNMVAGVGQVRAELGV